MSFLTTATGQIYPHESLQLHKCWELEWEKNQILVNTSNGDQNEHGDHQEIMKSGFDLGRE